MCIVWVVFRRLTVVFIKLLFPNPSTWIFFFFTGETEQVLNHTNKVAEQIDYFVVAQARKVWLPPKREP